MLSRRPISCLVFHFILFAAFAFPRTQVLAATLHVSRLADDDSPGSLRYEIDHSIDGDTIDFQLTGCPCTIYPLKPLNVSSSITIRGLGVEPLSVDGSHDSSEIFFISNASSQFQISDLTIKNSNNTSIDVSADQVRISNVAFINNAGALFLGGRTAEISDCLFDNNVYGTNGGAIYSVGGFTSSGGLSVINSSFINNVALSCGGAIYSETSTLIQNSTFYGNRTAGAAFGYGGAICAEQTIRDMQIVNSTFIDNSAESRGGALFIEGSSHSAIVVANSVFASNHAEFGPNISGGIVSLGNNLVSDRSGSFGYQKTTCNPAFDVYPADLPEEDPKLSPLHISRDSGLPINTPELGSPLIDAISIGFTHCDGVEVPKTDARGVARPYHTAADIGAIEFIPDDDRIFCDGNEPSGCKPLS